MLEVGVEKARPGQRRPIDFVADAEADTLAIRGGTA
jgi:hypothetical protein